jgi:pimeloyl-ACP methyl ester carboxylesterase
VAAAPARPALRAPRRRGTRAEHFVLVHGAWHGAWCWYRIATALEALGHRVTALDLPAAGIDPTPPLAVGLQEQADRVVALLDTLDEPVVLVGHSAGGPVVSTVAEARPQKIAKLVYVTAFLLADGDFLAAAASRDPDSAIIGHLVLEPDGTLSVDPAARRDVFYGDCRARDVTLAQALLRPVGARSLTDRVHVGTGFAGVRRFYVTCRHDRAISPAAQRTMYEALPCELVLPIASDHSPFLSRPRALVLALVRIARA